MMHVENELLVNFVDKKTKEVHHGRIRFLNDNGLQFEPKQITHCVSYNGDKPHDVCIEVYVDQICIAAQLNFPDDLFSAVIGMLTEDLLAQACMSEYGRDFHRFHNDSYVNGWMQLSVIDEFVEAIVGTGYSREIRNRRVSPRVLPHLIRAVR